MKSSFHQWYTNSLTAGLSPESEQYREVRTTDGAVTIEVRGTARLPPVGKEHRQVRTPDGAVPIEVGGAIRGTLDRHVVSAVVGERGR